MAAPEGGRVERPRVAAGASRAARARRGLGRGVPGARPQRRWRLPVHVLPAGVGTEVALELELADRVPLTVAAVVVRTQVVREVGAGLGLSGMALRFQDMPGGDRQRLATLVESVRDALEAVRRDRPRA